MKIKVVVRDLLRYRLFSGLNILGLSIGLTSVLVISLWVYNESGFDKFNKNYDRIFQINFKNDKGEFSMAGTPDPLAPAIIGDVTAIESAVRLRNAPGFAFKYGNNLYFEEKGLTSDPQLFDIFSFKTIEGDPKEALDQVNGLVITQSFSKRYFGSADPLNKEIQIEGKGYLVVMAVIDDVPQQSHIQFDYLLSQKFSEENHLCGMEWGDPNFRTYILLKKGTDQETAALAITRVAKDKGMPHVKYGKLTAFLRPLKNIYLDYKVNNRLGETGDYRYLYIFSTIAFLILMLACINYVNLTLSLHAKRLKSTSIRKVCGAERSTIFWNSFIESSAVVILAFILTVAILWLLMPFLHTILNKVLFLHLFSHVFAELVGGLLLVTILLCSVYPSIIFSGSKAIAIMNRQSERKTGILKSLVVFQNLIALILIVAALGINRQMQYIRHKKLGFNTEQIAYTYLRGDIYKKISTVRQTLLENPNISVVSIKDCLPYSQVNGTVGISWKNKGGWQNEGKQDPISMETTRIDDQYFKMMDVQFASGRNFSQDLAGDRQNYIVNEEAVRLMGLDHPVGNEFKLYGQAGIIVGVIRNTYFKSLHENINPRYSIFTMTSQRNHISVPSSLKLMEI
jgi:putative ABC transport system permease protein